MLRPKPPIPLVEPMSLHRWSVSGSSKAYCSASREEMLAFLTSATLMLISADGAVFGAGVDATTTGRVPTETGGSATGCATGSATTGAGERLCRDRSSAGAACTSDHNIPYATNNPAATPILAFRSPGSVDGGAFRETSQPHCLHSFASGSIGSPQ